MTKKDNSKTSKDLALEKRLLDVERYLVRKFNVVEIAEILGVSTRTVDRDISEIRKKNLKMFQSSMHVKSWIRQEWSDAISSLNEAEKMFWQFSSSAQSEATKAKCVWLAVQTITARNEILNSIGFSLVQKNFMAQELYQPPEMDEHIRTSG